MMMMKGVVNKSLVLAWLCHVGGWIQPIAAQPVCDVRTEYTKSSNKIFADILIQFAEGTRQDLEDIDFLYDLANAIPSAYDKVAGTLCDGCRRNIDSVTLLTQNDPNYLGFQSAPYVIVQVEVSQEGGCTSVFDSRTRDEITPDDTNEFVEYCTRFTTTVPDLPTGNACCNGCAALEGVVSTIDFADQLAIDLGLYNANDDDYYGYYYGPQQSVPPIVREMRSFPSWCSTIQQQTTTTLYLGSDSPIPPDTYQSIFGYFIATYNLMTVEDCYAQRLLSIDVVEDFGFGNPIVRHRHLQDATVGVPCTDQYACLQIDIQKRCNSWTCPLADDPPFCQFFEACGSSAPSSGQPTTSPTMQRRRNLDETANQRTNDPDSDLAESFLRQLHNDQYFADECVCALSYGDGGFSYQLPNLGVFLSDLNQELISLFGIGAVDLYEPVETCQPNTFSCAAFSGGAMDMVFNITVDGGGTPLTEDEVVDFLIDWVPQAYDVVAGTVCDPCTRRLVVFGVGWVPGSYEYEVSVSVEQSGSCFNIFDTSTGITTLDERFSFEATCGMFHDLGNCCCGCTVSTSLVSKEDFRQQLELSTDIPILGITDATEVAPPTPSPTPQPTFCVNPDLPCPPDTTKTITTNIMVEIGRPIDSLPAGFPFEFVNIFPEVYNAVAGSICDKCRRRIVDAVVPIFPEDFIGASSQVRYRFFGGRDLQQAVADAPEKIILSVTIEQSDSEECEFWENAFDGATDVVDLDDINRFENECGTFYNPFGGSGGTCCCLCSSDGSQLELSREDFREALEARLQVPVLTVSEVEEDRTDCPDIVRTEETEFIFDLEEPLNSLDEERVFLAAFIAAYNQACLDNCIHIEILELFFVDTPRRSNRNLQGRFPPRTARGIRTANCVRCPVNRGNFRFGRRLAEQLAMESVLRFRETGEQISLPTRENGFSKQEVASLPFMRNLQENSFFVEQCLCRADVGAPPKVYDLPTSTQTTELMNEKLEGTGISNITTVEDPPPPPPPPRPAPRTKGKGKGWGKGKGKGRSGGMGSSKNKKGMMSGKWMGRSNMKSSKKTMVKTPPKTGKMKPSPTIKMYYRHPGRRRPVPARPQKGGDRPPTTPRNRYNPPTRKKRLPPRKSPMKRRPVSPMKMNKYPMQRGPSPMNVFRRPRPSREKPATDLKPMWRNLP